ncbi:hypothetical protein ABZS63_32080, partial [Streptomyces sp. NPDC005568]
LGDVAAQVEIQAGPHRLQAAKALPGASWILGRAGLPGHEVRRGPGPMAAQAGCGAAEVG